VIIIGGGLAGLACGIALSGAHLSIPLKTLIVDAGPPLETRDLERDSRGTAITRSSRVMLEAIGVWDKLAAQTQSFNSIVVTDSRDNDRKRPALLNFLSTLDGTGPSAWMVENPVLMQAIIASVQTTPNLTVVTDTTVDEYQFTSAQAKITTSSGKQFSAPLIIAADGRSSRARLRAGIEVVNWDYGQSGIALTVAHEKPHNGCAEEHFREAGPFAILPLPGNRSSIVWTEKTRDAEQLMALSQSGFLSELKTRFGDHLGEVELASAYASWPLKLQIAKSFSAQRLALVGDAAHIIHPIAGLGFNLGLRDIAALTQCIIEQVHLGLDHGGPVSLANYEKWRRADTIMVAAACDGLNRLFSNASLPTTALRQAGLKLVDQIPPLKGFFMDAASGLAGEQPKLMKGEAV